MVFHILYAILKPIWGYAVKRTEHNDVVGVDDNILVICTTKYTWIFCLNKYLLSIL